MLSGRCLLFVADSQMLGRVIGIICPLAYVCGDTISTHQRSCGHGWIRSLGPVLFLTPADLVCLGVVSCGFVVHDFDFFQLYSCHFE